MSVTTKVQVLLDIQTEFNWIDDCSIAQIKKQSIDSANTILVKALENTDRIKIIGKPECINIIIK